MLPVGGDRTIGCIAHPATFLLDSEVISKTSITVSYHCQVTLNEDNCD